MPQGPWQWQWLSGELAVTAKLNLPRAAITS